MKEEIFDHKITEKEAANLWSIENMHTFNERATAETLYLLYRGRHDEKMAEYYESKIIPYERWPKQDDCVAREEGWYEKMYGESPDSI